MKRVDVNAPDRYNDILRLHSYTHARTKGRSYMTTTSIIVSCIIILYVGFASSGLFHSYGIRQKKWTYTYEISESYNQPV